MVILAVYLILVYTNRKDITNAIIWPILLTLIFWFIVGGCLVGSIIRDNAQYVKRYERLDQNWSIKSTKFDSKYHGSFILGTGSIEREEFYFVFTDMGGGRWLKQQFPMKDTYIVETSTPPRALAYHTIGHSDWHRFWFWGIENFLDISYKYVLEVPKGSIIEEYKL